MNLNGWTLKAHPAFSEYFKKLIVTVEQLEESNPETYQSHPSTKLLNIIKELVYNHIPRDPTAKEFRQGKKLGADRKHSMHRSQHRQKLDNFSRIYLRIFTPK